MITSVKRIKEKMWDSGEHGVGVKRKNLQEWFFKEMDAVYVLSGKYNVLRGGILGRSRIAHGAVVHQPIIFTYPTQPTEKL